MWGMLLKSSGCRCLVPGTSCLVGALVLGAAATLGAQETPKIHTSAQAEVTVPAARAHLVVGATATSDRARDAGARVAEIVNAIRDALVGFGLDRGDVVTAGYSVSPTGDDLNQPRRYTAVSSVSVDVDDLGRLGAIVDTALGAGATNVSRLTFEAANPAEARARAIADAYAKARDDAEALARAAGRTLGPAVLLSTDQAARPFAEPMMVQRFGGGTELPAPDVTISAAVSVDWQLN